MAEDDDDMGAMWRAVKESKKQKRANNRFKSAQLLREAGMQFESKNFDAHLIVKHGGRVVDFWPGTGLWIDRKPGSSRAYGVRALMTHLRRQADLRMEPRA